jgi:hypothetical protein
MRAVSNYSIAEGWLVLVLRFNSLESLNNSPRKDATSSPFLAGPSTPSTSRMAEVLQQKLSMESGGSRKSTLLFFFFC